MLIKEFLPNPIGNDQEGEYIKLFNDGPAVILLNGWSLKDASGKVYKLNGNLDSQKELILPYSQTRISLNNNGEIIYLYDSAGKLIDQLSYTGQASEGQIIIKNQELKTKNEILTTKGQNYNSLDSNPSTFSFLYLDFLSSVVLAGLGLYIILQLEKKLDIKLW